MGKTLLDVLRSPEFFIAAVLVVMVVCGLYLVLTAHDDQVEVPHDAATRERRARVRRMNRHVGRSAR